MARTQKMIEVLVIAAVFVSVANIIGGKHGFIESLVGSLVLVAIILVGHFLHILPGFKKFPLVFWVTMVGVIVSIPGVPGQPWFIKTTQVVDFLPTTVPVLAYAGLSLGKDLPAFRRLSWRIVPVALAVSTGTFLFAVIIAQLVLHMEGVI